MKILHVADFLPVLHKRAGGAEFATQRIIDEQVADGIEVEVASLAPDIADVRPPWRHYTLRNLDRWAPRLAYAVKQLYFPQDGLAARDMARILEISRPDVVHFHNLHFSGLGVVPQARRQGIPSVWSIYDYWIFCPAFMLLTHTEDLCTRGHGAHCVDCIGARRLRFLRPVKQALFAARPHTFAEPVQAVDRFVTLSNASGELLQRHGVAAGRIAVIPQHIWKEAAAKPRAQAMQRGRLVYVGWVEHRKGLHVIIEAMGLLASQYPELELDVFGQPAHAGYETELRQRIKALDLEGRVHWRGKIGRSGLIDALHQAMLVTIPEQWENMSPVILTEAMAAGACVLASRIGGIRHFVEEGRSGLLAERDSAQEFARQIDWAMQHFEAVGEMAAAASARAQELFNTLHINRLTRELYDSLSPSTHGPLHE
ncbi:MAG: glycosyltransferase [Pseudomonadota bacterium]